jgi:hypothetical protein
MPSAVEPGKRGPQVKSRNQIMPTNRVEREWSVLEQIIAHFAKNLSLVPFFRQYCESKAQEPAKIRFVFGHLFAYQPSQGSTTEQDAYLRYKSIVHSIGNVGPCTFQ